MLTTPPETSPGETRPDPRPGPSVPPVDGRFRLRGAGLALLHMVFAGAVAVHLSLPFLLPEGKRSDFGLFYLSVVEAQRDGDPYTTRLQDPYGEPGRTRVLELTDPRDEPTVVGNLNSPVLIALLMPLRFLDYTAAMWVWYGLGLAAGILAGFVMAATWLPGRPLHVWGPTFATGVLLFYPSLANAWLAQFGLFLTLAAALVFWLVVRGRGTVAAAVLGVAAALKVFVGLFGALFLLGRRWRALTGFTAAFAASALFGALVLGWHTYLRYAEMLGGVVWYPASWNASVFGVATRLLGYRGGEGVVLDLPDLAVPAARGAALLLGAGWAWLVVRTPQSEGGRGEDPRAPGLLLGLTFVMMLLLSPLGWLYYFPALLPACAALVARARPGRERVVCLVSVGLFIVLSSVAQKMYTGTDPGEPGYEWWKAELPVVALLVLAGAHAWILLRSGGPCDAEARARV